MPSPSRWTDAFTRPAAATMFFFGFISGLPFLLVGGTLTVWLKDSGMSLEHIGLFSLLGLAYSLKFLWAPLLDRHLPPLFSRAGQRRGWLLLAQGGLTLALAAMALSSPGAANPGLFLVATALAAICGATQDVVIDAYRIEIAPAKDQGALAATQTLGYRLALLVSGAFALFAADHVPWPAVYAGMATVSAVMMLATVLAREPQHTIAHAPVSLGESVVAPFRDVFARYPGRYGLALIVFMGLFKISDQMLGVMAMPYYLDCGFSKTDIAAVSKLFGVWIGIAGAFIGGASVARLGVNRTLLIAMILAAGSNLLYLPLAAFPAQIPVFVAVIGGDNLAGGFLGTAAVAFLSARVNQQHTATQYALFSSLVTLPGKLIGGVSGYIVAFAGYHGFFLFSTVAILPAIVLFLWLKPRFAEVR